MQRRNMTSDRQAGFTLVELALVIMVIGVVAAFGIPRFNRTLERNKALEAFQYLGLIQTAQEQYQARYGSYATNVTDLELKAPLPRYFSVSPTFSRADTSSLQDSWTLTLTRIGSPLGYGEYTVIFTDSGFDKTNSSIAQPLVNTDIKPTNNN